MKKLISAILILFLLPLHALAEYDLSSMTDQQLIDLIARASAELSSRSASSPDISPTAAPTAAPAATFEPAFDNSIDGYRFILVEKTMADYLGILNEYSATDVTPINDEYRIATHNDIRLLYRGSRIVKASVFLGQDEKTVLWACCLVSALEGDLLNHRYMTITDKANALATANKVVQSMLDSAGNISSVAMIGIEGFRLPATTGKYDYYYEYIDGQVWLSAVLADLPEGIY